MSPHSTVCCQKNLSTHQQLVIKNQNQKKNVSKSTQGRKKERPRRPKGTERHEDRRPPKEAAEGTMYKKAQTRLIMKKPKKLPAVAKKALKRGSHYVETAVESAAVVVTVAVEVVVEVEEEIEVTEEIEENVTIEENTTMTSTF